MHAFLHLLSSVRKSSACLPAPGPARSDLELWLSFPFARCFVFVVILSTACGAEILCLPHFPAGAPRLSSQGECRRVLLWQGLPHFRLCFPAGSRANVDLVLRWRCVSVWLARGGRHAQTNDPAVLRAALGQHGVHFPKPAAD